MESIRNTLIILLLAGVVSGVGGYVTFGKQKAELAHLEEQRELARLQQAEAEELLSAKAISEETANDAVRKWNARYKYVAREINTSDIVEYLESLTRRGYDSFNIRLEDVTNSPDISYYTFRVEGAGYYSNVYDFVWHIENNRDFYGIRDLTLTHTEIFDENPSTGEQRRRDMVRFSMKLDAYFGGPEGLSTSRDELIPISRELLPVHDPVHNSFYPIVREALPPNDENRLDVEHATLLAIADGKAIIEDQQGRHTLAEGDRVYLGRIISIDVSNAVVVARINKGGIVHDIELRMENDR